MTLFTRATTETSTIQPATILQRIRNMSTREMVRNTWGWELGEEDALRE